MRKLSAIKLRLSIKEGDRIIYLDNRVAWEIRLGVDEARELAQKLCSVVPGLTLDDSGVK